MSPGASLIARIEAIQSRPVPKGARSDVIHDATCEACGDHIPIFVGYPGKIICERCLVPDPSLHYCGNQTPGDWSGAEDYEGTEP